MPDDFEDVSGFSLSDEREATLLRAQTECTFMWTTREGDPVGVIMNFLWHEGRFWLTATRRRKRIAAIERDPRVAIAISSRGTRIGISQAVTYKGTAVLHDDEATKAWFYAARVAWPRRDRDRPDEAHWLRLRSDVCEHHGRCHANDVVRVIRPQASRELAVPAC
jgi:general stress protein 26